MSPSTDVHLVVLAAGKGTRMKSAFPKILHRAAGLRLIDLVFRAAEPLHVATTALVVGHQTEIVHAAFADRPSVTFVVQEPQLGTGHALLQAEPFLSGKTGTVLLLSGDVPLLRPATIEALVGRHRERQAAATVLVAAVAEPDGY